MSDHSTTTHATASAGTDALRNPGPVVRANSMRAGLLNLGRTLDIGCWNARTFLDPATQSLTACSLHQYNVDVCCLTEVRLPDSGSPEIKIPGVESHFTLYHSSPRDSSGWHGVAIALSQQADLALFVWEPVNDRMAYVRLKGHFTNISIVAVYAPTSAAEQRDKEAFYSQLQALVERLPRRDLLIVAGDWNGRTGPGDHTTSHLLGRFGLGFRCENGERLLNFTDRNRLLVTNTCFQHRKKHLLTWYSNDSHTTRQIDYILVSSRFRSWVHDSRSMLGAETGNAHGSDHVLVRTRLKVHLSSAPKMPRPRRLNVAKIRQASTAEALTREIRTCFTTRADGEVSNQWSSLETSVYGAAEKILGYTQRRRREVADAIRKLRKNKAPGEDGIPAEIFKSCVDTLAPWLHEVMERAWRDEVVPDDWGLGILVPILKKGDKTRCENYRGISLIDVAAKIFAIVLLSYQQPTAVCFVDFAAAFDSVDRESLWRIMALDGEPAKIIAMIKAYYRSITARVLVRNNLFQPFGIRSGVRQGCILSPILFNYAIDWILGRALRDSDGVEFAPGHRLTDLDYADDIALLASSFGDLQSMVSRMNEVAKSVGLSINAGKTKVFSSCIPNQEKAPLGIDGCQLEEVDSFKYLGARLLPNGQSKDDIVSRIDTARCVFSSLRKCLWNRRDLSIATKIRVYRASVRSVLLYGCECWALRVEDGRKLEVFDHHCLRAILQVKFTDFVSNETVRARCDNIARITQAIQEGRLRWFGHVPYRPPQEPSVTALDPAPLPHWRRRRGGQFKTWPGTVRQDMEVVLGPSVVGLRRWRREGVELSRSAAADCHA
nr:unnamed protein product [Spirometra erinaceieuropaei]